MAEWSARKHVVGGITEGFRGWDALFTVVEAIKIADKAEPGRSARRWPTKVKGINGDIAFTKQGPAGQESGQNLPSVYLIKIDGGKVSKL